MKSWFQFYVYSNIHVALSFAAMMQLTAIYFNIELIDETLVGFLATLIVYNYIRWIKYKNNSLNHMLSDWFTSNKKKVLTLCVFSLVLLLGLLSKMESLNLNLLFGLVVLTFFYVRPKAFKFQIRSIPFIKLFSIISVWVSLVVLWPVLNHNIPLSDATLLWVLHQFMFVFLWAIPFDIRDCDFDMGKVKTLPQLLGIQMTKILSCILSVISILGFYFVGIKIGLVAWLLLIPFTLFTKPNKDYWFTAFWVEAIPIFWLFAVFFV